MLFYSSLANEKQKCKTEALLLTFHEMKNTQQIQNGFITIIAQTISPYIKAGFIYYVKSCFFQKTTIAGFTQHTKQKLNKSHQILI